MKLIDLFESLAEAKVLKLGNKNKTIDLGNNIEKNREFVREIYNMGNHNPFGGGVYFTIRNDDDSEGIVKLSMTPMTWGTSINELHVAEGKAGQGFGDYILSVIVDKADQRGISLALNAVPLDTEGKKIPKNKLIKFYRKHGFELEGRGSDLMRREPR